MVRFFELNTYAKVILNVFVLCLMAFLYNINELPFLTPIILLIMFFVIVSICLILYKDLSGSNIKLSDIETLTRYVYVIKKNNILLGQINNEDSERTINLGKEILQLIDETEDVMKSNKFSRITYKYMRYLNYLDYITTNEINKIPKIREKQNELKKYIRN